MIEIYLVRHGDITAPKNIYYGRSDFELSNVGLSQAKSLNKYFKDVKLDFIYSSPLKRAYVTAQTILHDKDLNIIMDQAIAERDFGIWEGLTYKELCDQHPNECKNWEEDWIDYQITDGESYRDFYNRVTSFVTKKLASHNDETICSVTHSGVVCTIISCLLGMSIEDIWRFKVDKGSVSKLVLNNSGYAYLEMLNLIP